jgi:hypothetical protein
VAIKTLRPNDPEDSGDDDDSSSSDEEASSSEGDNDDDDDDQEDTSPNDDGPDDSDLEDPSALEESTPSNNVDMYEALAANHEHSKELAIAAELREQDSDDGPLSEGDITSEANKGVTEPTPGVPKAAAIPKNVLDIVWPKHRAQSGGKRQFQALPLQRDRPPAREANPDFSAKPSTKQRVNHIRHKAFLAEETSYGYVAPKVKIRSILFSQQDIETLYNIWTDKRRKRRCGPLIIGVTF